MITDEQYSELQNRVNELEKKLSAMSRQLSSYMMRSDRADVNNVFENQGIHDKRKNDTTKYKFNGNIFCKRRLVLECVKKYAYDNNVTDLNSLLQAFPDYIQGSLGIVKTANEAEKYIGAHKRFYFGDEDIFHFSDEDVVVCSQWDRNNINRFIKRMESYGYKIEKEERLY